MTAEPDLLPLPQLCIAPSVEPVDYPDVAQALMDYARTCVAHATAAKDAEIEALRAEASTAHEAVLYHIAEHAKTRARAERLAEALREAEEYIDDVTPTWASKGQRVLDTIRTALHPAAAQDGGNACHHINTVRGEDGVRWCQHCRQQLTQETVRG